MLAFRGATDTYVKSSVHCSGEQDTRRGSGGARLWDRCRCQQSAAGIRQKPGCRAAMEMPQSLPACITREHQHPADIVSRRPPPQLGLPLPTPPFPPPPALLAGIFHVLTGGAFGPPWRASPAPWSASALKPLQSPNSPSQSPRPLAEHVPDDLDLGSTS